MPCIKPERLSCSMPAVGRTAAPLASLAQSLDAQRAMSDARRKSAELRRAPGTAITGMGDSPSRRARKPGGARATGALSVTYSGLEPIHYWMAVGRAGAVIFYRDV